VFVLFDCDESGTKAALSVMQTLKDVGAIPQKINQFDLLNNPKKGYDVADYIYEQLIERTVTQ
jgi:5S rRNA maturation endonuclease (ribonuclease M5)